MNIAIIRAFIALRHYALTFDKIAAKVLEHDKEIADINEAQLRFLVGQRIDTDIQQEFAITSKRYFYMHFWLKNCKASFNIRYISAKALLIN